MEYDDIIVGGGSAGAVLAARLSEEPARRVLLLEAGPDYATLESTPDDLQDGWRMSLRAHDWGLTAEAVPGRAIPYPRGRVIGGSSAVNATIALRGVPADYDEWAALGNDEWSWAKVLPHFRRLEDDPEGAGELHGRGGPIAIRRWRREELIPIQRAFFEVCRRLGFPEVTDHNHPKATGVGPFPQNRRGRLRLSTAIAYLLPARHRPNLTIRPHCLVNRVLVRGRPGASAWRSKPVASRERVRGRRITLAAGAIGSPAILLRSGIGPKAALLEPGHRPGGRSSRRRRRPDRSPGHPRCCSSRSRAAATRRPRSRRWSCATRPPARASSTTCSRSSSATSTWPRIGGEQAVAAVGTPLAIGLPVALERPHARGRLSLASTDPRVQPLIELNFAADPEDLRRLVEGVRLAWQIAHQPEIARHIDHVALLTEETMGSDEALAALRPRDGLDPVSSLRHGADGPGRRPDGRGRPALPASARSRTCAWSTRRSCRPSHARTSTSPAS